GRGWGGGRGGRGCARRSSAWPPAAARTSTPCSARFARRWTRRGAARPRSTDRCGRSATPAGARCLPTGPRRRDTSRRPGGTSAHVAGVAERVAARLRPHGEPVRLLPDGDRGDLAGAGVEDVDDVVVAAREPELGPVGADVPHVGAPAAGYRPDRLDCPRGEIHHRDAARTFRLPANML